MMMMISLAKTHLAVRKMIAPVCVYGTRATTKWIKTSVRMGVPVVVYGCH
jgi:hypothetical protein